MRRMRTVTPVLPTETGSRDGLAYTLWLPASRFGLRGGIVILHGAGSCKESHHDFARAALPLGIASIAFDQRGHGESGGRMGAGALTDVAAITARLRAAIGDRAPIGVRGSSMGGYLSILAAPLVNAAAVVAICPASSEGLRRGLAERRFSFDADVEGLDQFLAAHELHDLVPELEMPLLLMHAEGDEHGPGAAFAGARGACRQSGEPPDRATGRTPPLDPARRGDAGRQPPLHRPRVRGAEAEPAPGPPAAPSSGRRAARRPCAGGGNASARRARAAPG